MRYLFIAAPCFVILFGDCRMIETPSLDNNEFTEGKMSRAWYESGTNEAKYLGETKKGFFIVADPGEKATHLASQEEQYLRKRGDATDPLFKYFLPEKWASFSAQEKKDYIRRETVFYKQLADSIHRKNNQNRNQILMINQSPDTVSLQMQDGSYICVLQALNRRGKWHPIQYWRFSTCGNSYYIKHLPPGTVNRFLAEVPNRGDFQTKLRFKLLGADRFYYSNEFDGRIDYCEFVQNKEDYLNNIWNPDPDYKLDTFIYLPMF